MKVFIIALLFVVVVAAEKKMCGSTSDCDENECCAKSTGSAFFRKGRCRPLSKEKGSCTEKEINGVYFNRCPCENGLVCKPKRIIKSKHNDSVEVKIHERCVNENEVTTDEVIIEDE